jgi:hypothetical protein
MDAVSTASDQSDSVKRIRRAILAVFFVVAAVWGALFAKHLHDIEVKHAAASREFERFQAEYSSIMIIGGDAGRLFQHIGAMDREARDAGQKRHDDGESDAPDVTYMYAQAKREYSDVEDMQATLSKMYDQFESLGDEYDNALGHGSASAFKSHLRNANEAWEDGLSSEFLTPPRGGSPVPRSSPDFVDALISSGEGNFTLVDAGVILEPVSINNIHDITADLFQQLVSTHTEPTEVEEERNIQRLCDRIIAETKVSIDPNFKRGYAVRYNVGDVTINLDLDYAYRNGALRRAYRRVPLPETKRDREHSLLSSMYVFNAMLESEMVASKDDLVALIGPRPAQKESSDVNDYLAALANKARIIDVSDKEQALGEFESLKELAH